MIKKIIVICTIILFIIPSTVVWGQETPSGPYYEVQSGDSLWAIAQRFGVSMNELATINNIADPSQLSAGMTVIIPGLEGISGKLTTRTVNFGETFRSLSRYYQIPPAMLARLNHLASPGEVYAGYSLVITEDETISTSYDQVMVEESQTLLELAVLKQMNPWKLTLSNQLPGMWAGLSNDPLLVPSDQSSGLSALPKEIRSIELNPLPLLQGKLFVSRITAEEGVTVSGQFMEYPMRFFPEKTGALVNLQGVHAMTDPGLYPLTLTFEIPGKGNFRYSQMVNVNKVEYPYDPPLIVDAETIDPENTKPEEDQWRSLTTAITEEKLWEGKFIIPSPLSEEFCLETNDCWSSKFGNRRSYNGSAYTSFHTGLDIVGKTGTDIYAPAGGVVVFTGTLTVRGNATMIDHGWGVYSAYIHQSEILVEVGDQVEVGQLIGKVGDTGRVEGPHLHWEIWAGGVQVDPLDWLIDTYP